MTKEEYLKKVNAERLANKGRWVNGTEQVNGVKVGIKAFDTWVQVMQIGERGAPNSIRSSGPMDCSVADYKAFIAGMLKHIPEVTP